MRNYFIISILINISMGLDFLIAQSDQADLPALQYRELWIGSGTRDFFTPIKDSELFNTIHPGSDKSCGFILRHYFYTNIFLNKASSVLYSMDGSRFLITGDLSADQKTNDVIAQTKAIIITIKGMSLGNREYRTLVKHFPDIKI